MKCPHCQSENPESRKFCRECGAKLVQVCLGCGFENSPGDKFCGECGHPLIEEAPAPIISPPPHSTSFAGGRFINLGGVKHQVLNDLSWAFSSGFLTGTNAGKYLESLD